VLSSLFSFLFYFPVVYALYDKIDDVRLLFFSAAMLLVNSLACEWYFLGTEQFRYISLRLIVTRLAGLAAIFLFVHDRTDYHLYYVIMVLAVITNMVWNFYVLARQVGVEFREVSLLPHIRHTWVTFLMNILYGIPFFLDNVLLGVTFSAFAVGIYAFGMKVIRLIGMAVTESLMVFFPRIVTYISLNKTVELQALHLKILRLILLFCIPVCVGLLMISDEAVNVIFGSQFAGVAINLKILSVFPLLKSYSLFQRNEILLPYHKEKWYVQSLAAGAATFVVTALILCPLYGDVGACISMIIAELVVIIANAAFIRRMTDVAQVIEWKTAVQSLAASLLFVPVIYLFRTFTINEYAIVAGGIISCTLLYVLVQIAVFKNPLVLEIRNSMKRPLL
jgi:O-antigen/teichoic acid export membrane protein